MRLKSLLLPASALPVIALLAYGLTRDPNLIESPLPGRPASDFISVTLDGDTLKLSGLEGKVIVVNFWASWCIACIDEHAVLIAAERYYADRDVALLGVVYQDSPDNARGWMQRMGGDWPSVLDENSRIAIDYGVYGVPETFFIGKDGRVAYKQIGPVNWPLVQHWIDRLLVASPSEDIALEGEGAVPAGRSLGHVRGDQRQAAEREIAPSK